MADIKRFATIDLYSGYVWWVGEAENPADACAKSDAETGMDRGGDGEWSWVGNQSDGYAVYAVPAGFDVDDGQSKACIEAVEAHPLVGRLAWVPGDRD